MRNGTPVVDSDGHTYEPEDLYSRYLDPPFRKRVENLECSPFGKWTRLVDGRSTAPVDRSSGPSGDAQVMRELMALDVYERRFGAAFLAGWSAAEVASAQRAEGVDVSVVYGPGYDMWLSDIDPALAANMARAYARWLAQYREDSGGVIHGAAPLPVQDVGLALAELRYAYEECGIRAFWMRPNPVNGRMVGDAAYDPLYEAIQDLDVSLGLHTFIGSDLPEAGADRSVSGWVDGHVFVHPYEQQMAMVDMMARGVFERFPRLRVGFLEAGCSWVPYWLDRLEEHMEFVHWNERMATDMEPLDYFRRNCFVTTECEEKYAYQTIDAVGDESVLFATDYPHVDAINNYPGYVDEFLSNPRIADDSKRRVLWDNAQRFYRFDPAQLPGDVAAFVAAESAV